MKYIIRTTKSILPIGEDEIAKVVQAMDEKKIAVLKAGVVNGAYIISIERDIHSERNVSYTFNLKGENIGRQDYLTDIKDIISNPDRKLLS